MTVESPQSVDSIAFIKYFTEVFGVLSVLAILYKIETNIVGKGSNQNAYFIKVAGYC